MLRTSFPRQGNKFAVFFMLGVALRGAAEGVLQPISWRLRGDSGEVWRLISLAVMPTCAAVSPRTWASQIHYWFW
ncbi:hypothetical protein BJV78DRAFT_1264741, partial [Lactifluus subvellereus]